MSGDLKVVSTVLILRYVFHAGSQECDEHQWIILMLFLVVVFVIPGCAVYRIIRTDSGSLRKILAVVYTQELWYHEFVLLARRLVLVIITELPLSIEWRNSLLIIVLVGSIHHHRIVSEVSGRI